MDGGFEAGFQSPDIEELQATFERERLRLTRRMKHRERMARAAGLMDGILGQLGAGDVALDCGANVGEVTVPLAKTGAQVYAFEPDPIAFEQLQANAGHFENVQLINAAVSTEAGEQVLHRSANFAADPVKATVSSTLMAGKRDVDDSAANDVVVQVLSLPDILKDVIEGRVPRALPKAPGQRRKPGRCALLKLDVEGEELNLLPALHEADLLDGIATTLVETHQRKFPELRRDFLQMRRQIGGLYPRQKVNLDWK